MQVKMTRMARITRKIFIPSDRPPPSGLSGVGGTGGTGGTGGIGLLILPPDTPAKAYLLGATYIFASLELNAIVNCFMKGIPSVIDIAALEFDSSAPETSSAQPSVV